MFSKYFLCSVPPIDHTIGAQNVMLFLSKDLHIATSSGTVYSMV